MEGLSFIWLLIELDGWRWEVWLNSSDRILQENERRTEKERERNANFIHIKYTWFVAINSWECAAFDTSS